MKKLLLLAPVLFMFSFRLADTTLSKTERSTAAKLLTDTENGVFAQVKGLSEAQLKFKPAADRWSVEECVKHIAVTEQGIWQMVDGQMKKAANPEKRSEIKSTDEQVIQMLENRTQKRKTYEQFKPENTPFKSMADALASFKENRDKLINYVNTTQEDMRNHVVTLEMGMLDSYQMVLFIGAHSNRHTQQIEEVKADPNFPKN